MHQNVRICRCLLQKQSVVILRSLCVSTNIFLEGLPLRWIKWKGHTTPLLSKPSPALIDIYFYLLLVLLTRRKSARAKISVHVDITYSQPGWFYFKGKRETLKARAISSLDRSSLHQKSIFFPLGQSALARIWESRIQILLLAVEVHRIMCNEAHWIVCNESNQTQLLALS